MSVRRFGKPLVIGRTGPVVPHPPIVLPDQRAQLHQRSTRPPQPAARAQGPGILNATVPVRVFAEWAEYELLRSLYIHGDEGGLKPGDCYFGSVSGVDPNHLVCLFLALPTASGKVSEGVIDIVPPGGQPPAKQRPRWNWNGDTVKPTLTPSIRHGDLGSPWYWHGFLRNGVLEGCPGERAPA